MQPNIDDQTLSCLSHVHLTCHQLVALGDVNLVREKMTENESLRNA